MVSDPAPNPEVSSLESDAARKTMHPILALAFVFVLGMGCIGLLENYSLIIGLLIPHRPPPNQTDVGATFPKPAAIRSVTIGGVEYEYVAPADRRLQVIDGYVQLKIGMTREEVRAILGDPDRAYAGYTKGAPRQFTGWAYNYYLLQRHLNSYDSGIELFFSKTDHRLEQVVPSGLPGLKEIGGLQGKPTP